MEQTGRNASPRGAKPEFTSEPHQLIDQIHAATRPAGSRVAASVHRLADRVSDTTDRVAQRLEVTGARLKHAEQRLLNASSGYVREHPLRAMGFALAAGFLVSLLIAPRKPPVVEQESAGGGESSAQAG